jgi:hypothetical protein
MKVWAVVPLKAWRFQVSKANSEELRSHILEGAQVIFSTTTVAGEQSMAELYVTYLVVKHGNCKSPSNGLVYAKITYKWEMFHYQRRGIAHLFAYVSAYEMT